MTNFSYSMASVLVLVFGLGTAASAQEMAYPTESEVSYTLSTIADDGGRIYYNCDSVRSGVNKVLKSLGAEAIKVRCSGGIRYRWPAQPAHVTASFVAASMVKNNASPRKAGFRTVRLQNETCQVIAESLAVFANVMQIDILDAPSYCRTNSRIRHRFDVRVLAFE